MIADVIHEIEGVTMQLLSLKTKSGKREAGFMEYFDKDNLTLRHGDEESYMHLEYSQWPSSTGEANSADEGDIDEFRSKLIDTFVKYLDERFTVFSVPPLSLCRVFDTRLWPRERSGQTWCHMEMRTSKNV